jgi:multiple sugar transport system substrate-binding protein
MATDSIGPADAENPLRLAPGGTEEEMTMGKRVPKTAMALGAMVATAGLLLSGCSSTPAATHAASVSQADIAKAMKTPTTITFWTWNKSQPEIDLFEKQYPAIKVNLVNVGSGDDFYTKLDSALSAGKGAPDVAQVEYQQMPSYILGKDFADLTPYLSSSDKSKFAASAWGQVTTSAGVYGVPQDTGPLGLLYRSDIFSDAGITTPPATWADFAADAAIIHAKNPSQYIANISPSNASATLGLFAQAGATPFSYDGKKTVSIDLTSTKMVQVAQFWQKLVDENLVSTDPDFTDQWYQGLASGKYASWVSAAWGPQFLQGTAAGTSGKWSAAKLPQWSAGQDVSANVGGSADTVIASSKNPIASAKFAEFINTNQTSVMDMVNQQFIFPASKAALADPTFIASTNTFFAGQQVNKLFSSISPTVGSTFQWVPFMNSVFEFYNTSFGKALTTKGDLVAGLKAWQTQSISYAKTQGFTVK